MSELGILLALGAAALGNLSLLCKHRGAVRAPDVSFRSPWRSTVELFRSKWWAIGFAVAALAWVLHVAALAIAPLSMVQAVIAGGLVLLIFPAKEWFGITIGRRELAGICLSAVGLALLTITADPSTESAVAAGSSLPVETMAIFEGAAIAIGVVLMLSGTHRTSSPHRGVMLAAAAGIMLGVANVALKGITELMSGGLFALLNPWTLVAALGGVGAFFALARALQVGRPVEVIVISSVAVNIAAIVGGVAVFGDSMGSDTLGIALRTAAFAAIIAAAALVPAAPRHEHATA